jgi:uncharacterized heparinase superfamily protein
MNRLDQVKWYWHTLRYLTLQQTWTRVRRILRRRLWRIRGTTAPRLSGWQLAQTAPLYLGLFELELIPRWTELVEDALIEATPIADGRFNFLNQTMLFKGEIEWHSDQVSQLWRYHLHYFDYVQPLLIQNACLPTSRAAQVFQDLATSWIYSNRKLRGDGWHPYTISLRVVNWFHALSGLPLAPDFRETLLESLYGQVRFLFSDLELDVRGNHLLENLRALIWAGVAYEGKEPAKWLDRGLSLLESETTEQILPDGGHFERSPSYQLIVLKNYLEIGLWLRRNRHEVPAWLDEAIRRMSNYLVAILPPDGKLPLLKDTTYDTTPNVQDVLAAVALYLNHSAFKLTEVLGLYPLLLFGMEGFQRFSAWPEISIIQATSTVALQESGYYVIRSNGDYLIVDAGKVCPDYLPAHAHADLFTYEFHVAGKRIVVDSGVFEYQQGAWRDYFRSTSAHNTVDVSGQNQSEVWSSFRVARRAAFKVTFWKEFSDHVILQASHDGYMRFQPSVVHRRTILWHTTGFLVVFDELLGRGDITARNYVHLHPDVSVRSVSPRRWQLGQNPSAWLTSLQDGLLVCGQENPKQGWYSESFGRMCPNPVLILPQAGSLPLQYCYAISVAAAVDLICELKVDSVDILLCSQHRMFTLTIPHQGVPSFK